MLYIHCECDCNFYFHISFMRHSNWLTIALNTLFRFAPKHVQILCALLFKSQLPTYNIDIQYIQYNTCFTAHAHSRSQITPSIVSRFWNGAQIGNSGEVRAHAQCTCVYNAATMLWPWIKMTFYSFHMTIYTWKLLFALCTFMHTMWFNDETTTIFKYCSRWNRHLKKGEIFSIKKTHIVIVSVYYFFGLNLMEIDKKKLQYEFYAISFNLAKIHI